MTPDPATVGWAEPGDLAAVAARVAEEVARPGPKRIAMAGGSTPAKVLELLAGRKLDWRGVTVLPTDDRQVPHDHPASNFAKLAAALGGTGATLIPLKEGEPVAPFDLVWLGMGTDGHVASLFPQMAGEDRAGPHVVATEPDPLPSEAPFARLSLNLAALTATREIILVVTGADKRAVLERALAGAADALPVARLLRAAQCPVTIYWSA